ncbi:homoserine dehydrogenase [Niallia sp. XMNu-256]|uniref:homoserine dehydrogenase n=1 Tax=Niallia sp. XMNu-256 TaxID=3082444 RepID=UPI0030D04A36
MSAIHIAILGLGTVGKGVLETIETHQERLQYLLGKPVKVEAVLVKNLDKHKLEDSSILLTDQFDDILQLAKLDVVIDAIVGQEPAFTCAKKSIERGSHVITANKEMFAHHGKELLELAKKHQVSIGFEATVAGGIPVIQTLRKLLNVNRITKIEGIVNGTSNFILTNMREKGLPFADVLKEAQEKGFAEADPTNDIEGFDAYFKALVLSNVIFGKLPEPEHIVREGISHITREQIQTASSLGLKYKHIAKLEKQGGAIKCNVEPVLVTDAHPFYSVEGVQNALSIDADIVGNITLLGPGAGKLPTASAIIEDLPHLYEKQPLKFFDDKLNSGEQQVKTGQWLLFSKDLERSVLEPYFAEILNVSEEAIYVRGLTESMNKWEQDYPVVKMVPIEGEFSLVKELLLV